MTSPARIPILLVDDKRENLLALTAQLEDADGLELVLAASGDEALRQMLKREYALVLLDVRMPDMDGFEVAALMRANPKTREVPIIFVTADPLGVDLQFRGYESGAVDYLVKPVEPWLLRAKLGVFVRLYRQRQELAEQVRLVQRIESLVNDQGERRRHHDDPLHLLLVDDLPANLIALEALLADVRDVVLVKAGSGPEALRACARQEFAAILLDVQMPGMDGFETAARIHAEPTSSATPIIFVTAGMKEIDARLAGYRSGAVDYLIKPLEPAIVVSKIRIFCQLFRQRQALMRQAAYLEALVVDRTSELQRSNAEIDEGRAQLQLLLDSTAEGIYGIDIDGRCTFANQSCLRLLGYEHSEDLLGRNMHELVHARHADGSPYPGETCKIYQAFRHNLESHVDDEVFWRRDGRCFPVEYWSFPQRHDGQVIGAVVTFLDITERKRAAEEIRRHHDELQTRVDEQTSSLKSIVDLAAEGIVTTDRHGTILTFNRAAERMFGYTAAQVTGKNVKLLMPAPYAGAHDGYIARYLSSREPHVIGSGREVAGRRADDSVFPLYLALSEFEVAGETRFTGILRDITAEHDAKAALVDARNAAESAAQQLQHTLDHLRLTQEQLVQSEKLSALGTIVAAVAHELNTPIGNCVTVASTLNDHTLAIDRLIAESRLRRADLTAFMAELRTGLELLLRGLDRAAEQVTNFKQVAVDQNSSLRRRFDLREVLASVAALLQTMLRKTPYQLELDVPEGLELDSYPGPMEQVVTNLVNNSVLHGFNGRAHGTMRLQARAQDATVLLTYSDDGCGMSDEVLQRIFDPFFTTRLGTGGSGLGMSISYNLITGILGGSVHVASRKGDGCRFVIELPRIAPENVPLPR